MSAFVVRAVIYLPGRLLGAEQDAVSSSSDESSSPGTWPSERVRMLAKRSLLTSALNAGVSGFGNGSK